MEFLAEKIQSVLRNHRALLTFHCSLLTTQARLLSNHGDDPVPAHHPFEGSETEEERFQQVIRKPALESGL